MLRQLAVALKTYMLRQLAVVTAWVTANHVHHHLHGRLRGHVPLRPAAERAADSEQYTPVSDDVTEQKVDADDAMVIEERQRAAAAATDPATRGQRAREAGLRRARRCGRRDGGRRREGGRCAGGVGRRRIIDALVYRRTATCTVPHTETERAQAQSPAGLRSRMTSTLLAIFRKSDELEPTVLQLNRSPTSEIL